MIACLTGTVGVAPGDLEVGVGVAPVAEGAGRQPRHAARVAGGERNPEPVGGRVRQAVHAVGPEVVVLALLAVGDDGRPGGLERAMVSRTAAS